MPCQLHDIEFQKDHLGCMLNAEPDCGLADFAVVAMKRVHPQYHIIYLKLPSWSLYEHKWINLNSDHTHLVKLSQYDVEDVVYLTYTAMKCRFLKDCQKSLRIIVLVSSTLKMT